MENNLKYFKNPPAKFRGAPFWAWNCKLTKELVEREIECFNKMGMGGYTVHARTGLDIEYMGEEFMNLVRACVEKGKELNMETHLYDEDRWPSGFGGGKVTADKKYRYRYIVFTPDSPDVSLRDPWVALFAHNCPDDKQRELLHAYAIDLDAEGKLMDYRILKDGETAENMWYAYKEIAGSHAGFNNQSYVDTLNPEATNRFIETTHEEYKKVVGMDFGGAIPSMFTDEPEHVLCGRLTTPFQKNPVSIPYTDLFDDIYTATYGESFFEHLPELFWEKSDGLPSLHRYRFHDFLTQLFADSYAKPLGEWCEKNSIQLTGHMMDENGFACQTRSIGEAMRSYPYFQLPGIDILCNMREYTTAKQCQSVVHQTGRNGMTSELYGVTNWTFDFRGHKLQGDWQAALGVTHRVPHLAYASMAGESKRDYPASIFYQSPWYERYGYLEHYFGRVNTALTSGKPRVKLGVIHPIESYWLYYGCELHTATICDAYERKFSEICSRLINAQLDFDYISEALLTSLPHSDCVDAFSVGEMEYNTILVPDCIMLRSTTVERLERFADAGGRIVFMARIPQYVDALPSDRVKKLAERCIHVDYDFRELNRALEPVREVELVGGNGRRSERYIYQLRELNDDRILFIAQGHDTANNDIPRSERVSVRVKGRYSVKLMNAFDGTEKDINCNYKEGITSFIAELFDQDSLLCYLTAEEENFIGVTDKSDAVYDRYSEVKYIGDVSSYSLDEPNVLLLDRAEFAIDGGAIEPQEETLRIDNIVRDRVGFPRKPSSTPQPWLMKEENDTPHTLLLAFSVNSDIDITDAKLACEPQKNMTLVVNGVHVSTVADGYFTDEAIKTFPLPTLHKGLNRIEITMDFSRRTNVEWHYLLGSFGVQLVGYSCLVTELPKRIGYCDLTRQRMPFYAANVVYNSEFSVDADGEYAIAIPKFRCPIITVSVDGGEEIPVYTAPYRAEVGRLTTGIHTVKIRAYGNRYNSFGTLHLAEEGRGWIDSNAWRSRDNEYCREYLVVPSGILSAPKLIKKN